MPFVHVFMLEGRSEAQKRRLIQEMTTVMVDVCDATPERVGVVITEVNPGNWGRAGIPYGDIAGVDQTATQ